MGDNKVVSLEVAEVGQAWVWLEEVTRMSPKLDSGQGGQKKHMAGRARTSEGLGTAGYCWGQGWAAIPVSGQVKSANIRLSPDRVNCDTQVFSIWDSACVVFTMI